MSLLVPLSPLFFCHSKPLFASRRRRMLERQLGVSSLLHFNDERHTAFGISEGKRFPHVLVGDWIHHLEVWIGPALDNSSSNLGLHVGIIEIDDRTRPLGDRGACF